MPVCKNCGKEAPPGRFCPFCGSPLGEQPQSSPPPPQPPSPPPVAPPPSGAWQQPIAPQAGPQQVRGATQYGGAADSGSPLALGAGLAGTAGMVLCIIGSVTTWSNLYGIGVSGWEGDGKITMGVAVIALVFLVVGALTKARWPFIVSLILTVVAGGIFLYYIVDLASPAFGLYIGIAGAFIGLLGSILGISIRRA